MRIVAIILVLLSLGFYTTATEASEEKYFIQYASFSDRHSAEEYLKKTPDSGHLFTLYEAPDNGLFYVRVGGFGSEKEAHRAATKLIANGTITTYDIVKEEPPKPVSQDEQIKKQKEEEAKAQVADEARKRREEAEACYASKRYQLFYYQETIMNLLDEIKGYKAAQRKERAIERESGTVNLTSEYLIGQQIVTARENIGLTWAAYKKLGGKAASPEKVGHSVKDPCARFIADGE